MNTRTTQVSLRYKLKGIPSAHSSLDFIICQDSDAKGNICISDSAILFHFPLPLKEYQILSTAVLDSGIFGVFFLFHLFRKDLENGIKELFDFDLHC